MKFHWKPKPGVYSLVWDEAQKIAGKDPDFHRRDLYEAIEMGNYPEFEFGVQLIKEEDEFALDFDVLDPTKLWPEEIVPVKIIGKMTLDRNPDNVFAETEQVAFHVGNVVPGIDFSNDPMLQGRLFSYTDTQLSRLGGPNFHELPINRSIAPVHNNQRDGVHRMVINPGQVSYHKNGLQANAPEPASAKEGGYEHYQEKVDGRKVQARSESFKDHYSQAILFWNSMTEVEKQHINEAFQFEVGKLKSKVIQQRVVDMFANVAFRIAKELALAVGASVPGTGNVPDGKPVSPSLSQESKVKLPNTRKVAVLTDNGFDSVEFKQLTADLTAAGIIVEVVSKNLGPITGSNGEAIAVDHTFLTADSVQFDSVYVAGGKDGAANLLAIKKAPTFIYEAYSHFKAIGAGTGALDLLTAAGIASPDKEVGVTAGTDNAAFIKAVTQARHWTRVL